MTSAPTKLMTADELYEMPNDDNRYELVRGRLIYMSPSSVWSDAIGALMIAALVAFVRPRKLGVVGGAGGGFRLASDPDTLRVPDAWFVRADRIPAEGLPDRYWPGPPDLAVEVLSRTDRSSAIADKLHDYMGLGVRLVWLVDPRSKSAAVFREDRVPVLVPADGALDGEDILPGFTLPLRDVFP